MSKFRKGKDLLSLLANNFAISIIRTSRKDQEADMFIQQVKNYGHNGIKLMGFCLFQEQPIHNPDEPAKYWQRKKAVVLFCFEFTVWLIPLKGQLFFF